MQEEAQKGDEGKQEEEGIAPPLTRAQQELAAVSARNQELEREKECIREEFETMKEELRRNKADLTQVTMEKMRLQTMAQEFILKCDKLQKFKDEHSKGEVQVCGG